MKQSARNSSVILLTIFLFLMVSAQSIRLLKEKQGDEHVKKLSQTTTTTASSSSSSGAVNEENTLEDNNDDNSSFNQLMELEGCEKEDEECFKRRIAEEEVHLDYIYTQRHRH